MAGGLTVDMERKGRALIVYFTGTGNSRYCAELLADRLGDQLADSFYFIRDGIAAELLSDKPWVFVAPTYAWQIPRIFADFIESGSFSGSREAYFVLTCGSEIGNAELVNRALCEKKGLIYKGSLQVVMPENYIALFNAPGPEGARRIVDSARPGLEAGAACIRGGRDFPAPKSGPVDRLKSGVFNKAFYRFIIKAKPFTVSDPCTGCGKCAEGCVLSNIRLQDGRPVWGSRCTHCMACICGCPLSVIEYGKASAGKPRYQGPRFEG